MARINLLPWREVERQRRQRDFVSAVIAATIATLLLGVGANMQVSHAIENQNQRNEFLNGEIRKLDQQIKEIERLDAMKQDLLAKMNIIQTLQESRPEIVHLFDELVKGIPEGVFLVNLTQKGDTVEVEGQAQSNARVSALMRNIEESEWIENPQLQLIENKDETTTGLAHFRLSFKQHHQQGDADQAAAPAATGAKRAAKR